MRSLGAPEERERARLSAARLIEKIDNFLPSLPGTDIVFQKGRQARLALQARGARLGLRRYEQEMARKSRRKPLKSLKTDT
jgi:hypothetical protein